MFSQVTQKQCNHAQIPRSSRLQVRLPFFQLERTLIWCQALAVCSSTGTHGQRCEQPQTVHQQKMLMGMSFYLRIFFGVIFPIFCRVIFRRSLMFSTCRLTLTFPLYKELLAVVFQSKANYLELLNMPVCPRPMYEQTLCPYRMYSTC